MEQTEMLRRMQQKTFFKNNGMVLKAVNLLRDKGYLVSGDLVVVTQGDVMSTIGSTNTTRILTVE